MKTIYWIILILLLVVPIVAVTAETVNGKDNINGQIFENKELNVPSADFVPDEIIVKFRDEVGKDKIEKINSKHGGLVRETSSYSGSKRIAIPKGKKVSEMVRLYKDEGAVEYAEPNYVAHALMKPNDPYYKYQWHLDDNNTINPEGKTYNPYGGTNGGGIRMEEAWDISNGTGVIVAVIDTGVAYENYPTFLPKYYLAPDLAKTCFKQGRDFVNNDAHPNDDNSHGTHVTGTIAQSTNNNIGVAGVAFGACIMPVKVLDKSGSGYYFNIAQGIYFATDQGAKVISMSLGGPSPSTELKNALEYAYGKNVTIVAAAGNDGAGGSPSYPAAYNEYVIAVAATRYDETRASYSTTGDYVDIAAPGGDTSVNQNGDDYVDGVLQQTFNPNTKITNDFGYWFFQGTSMATPHVSGVAALVIANGVTGPDNVRAALETTAEDKGATGWDEIYGWGLVDAAAALTYVPGTSDNPPLVAITSPSDGDTVSGTVEITADATDDVGVVQVAFYYGSTLIGNDTDSPYSVSWNSTTVADGTYTLTATVMDTASQQASDLISVLVDNVNDPPVANAGPDQALADADGNGVETATLDGTASYDPDGTITSYQWTIGTKPIATTGTITYNFTIGTTTVTLTVTDDKGATSSNECIVIVEANKIPTASITYSPANPVVNETVNFDASSSSDPDGKIVSYDWNFGDGATSTGVTVTHVYSAAATYNVTLTVTDDGGLTGSNTAIVSVSEAPSEVTVFSDSFEVGEWNGLWTEDRQNDWFRSTQRAINGNYSAEVDGRASNAKLTSKTIDLLGKTNATITFSWYIESGLDSGEYLAFDVFTNEGTTWDEKARLEGDVYPEDVWHNVSIDLTGINSLRIQFRGTMSDSTEDANVDMVKVTAS